MLKFKFVGEKTRLAPEILVKIEKCHHFDQISKVKYVSCDVIMSVEQVHIPVRSIANWSFGSVEILRPLSLSVRNLKVAKMFRVYGIILLFLTLISFSYGEEKKRGNTIKLPTHRFFLILLHNHILLLFQFTYFYMISISLTAFSVFNIVKFANDACEGSDSKVQKMTHIKKFFFNFHIKLFNLEWNLLYGRRV